MKTKEEIKNKLLYTASISPIIKYNITEDIINKYLKIELNSKIPNSRYQQRNLLGVPFYRAYTTGKFIDYTKGEARADIARKTNQFGIEFEKQVHKVLLENVKNKKDIHYQRPIFIHQNRKCSDFFLHKGTELDSGEITKCDIIIDATYMSEYGADGNRIEPSNNIRFKDKKYKDIKGCVIVVINNEVNIDNLSYNVKNIKLVNLDEFWITNNHIPPNPNQN